MNIFLTSLFCVAAGFLGNVQCLDVNNDPLFLDVTKFGAVGDGRTDDTIAIRKALALAQDRLLVADAGASATVYFPKDKTFVSAPLNLSSHLLLQVDGTLEAIANTTQNFENNWPKLPPLPSYGNARDRGHYFQYQAFLYANQATNLIIRGQGVIDGQGAWWWDAFHNRPETIPAGRPNLIRLLNCTDVEITGVTLLNAAFWTLHPVYSTNVYIHHIQIRAPLYAPNVDGIDPDSSRNVMIEHNDISCGDDYIAIKAGVCGGPNDGDPIDCNQDDKFRRGVFTTSNITVRYNTFRTGMGVALGSELSGGIENVQVYQNIMGLCDYGADHPKTSCGWGHGIHMKTTIMRGGFLRNIQVHTNIIYNTTGFILLETDYQDKDHKQPPNYPTTEIRNISVRSNSGLGSAVAMKFGCSKYMQCEQVYVADNWILHGQPSNYHCSYVDTYLVEHNNVPSGLNKCMYESMNRTEVTSVMTTESFRSIAA
jgi:polygalacturonase